MSMPGKSSGTEDPVISRLRAIAERHPDLGDAALLYEAILPLLRDADLHAAPVSLTREEAREKLQKGQPLLQGLDLELDIEAVRELMISLLASLETAGRGKGPHTLRLPWLSSAHNPETAARRIKTALEEDRLDPGALLQHVAAGDPGMVISVAASLELDPVLLAAVAQNALKPALRVWCGQLAPLAADAGWNKATCFVCGAPATLAELQENNQVKHLRCGSCGADWQCRRLPCTQCGNEDPRTLHCLYTDNDRQRMHVEVCDRCRGYLKIISSFSPAPAAMLPVEDLETLHLDYFARNRGYGRPKMEIR